MSVLLDKNR